MTTPGPARLIGRYVLFGEIASGGMATVHYGRLSGPAGFARTVAIKRMHPQYARDPDFLTMFLDEARLAARIRHPNVVPTLDVIETEDEVFLVMEYVQGESLSKLLRAVRGMMTPTDTRVMATIVSGVLHGLHAAHEARSEQNEPLEIVHRDVSPQNILVGVDGVPRILDFGVARAAGRMQTTRKGQLKGKLAYMAPEQLHNLPVTRQTDIYATSVVAWEALTGRRLFDGENEAAIVTASLQTHVTPPSEVAPHVPLAVDRVVMRGLQRDPARRYATAREMALDLERSAGVAPPSEVGDWVESLARDELSRRAERIAEIENATSSVSSRRQTMPQDHEMPTVAMSSAPLAMELPKAAGASGVGPIIAHLPRGARRRARVWAGLGGAVVAGALLAVAVLPRLRGDLRRPGTGTAPPTATAALIAARDPDAWTPPKPPPPAASADSSWVPVPAPVPVQSLPRAPYPAYPTRRQAFPRPAVPKQSAPKLSPSPLDSRN